MQKTLKEIFKLVDLIASVGSLEHLINCICLLRKEWSEVTLKQTIQFSPVDKWLKLQSC